MTLLPPPSPSSTTPTSAPQPAVEAAVPSRMDSTVDVVAYRKTDEGKRLAAWVKGEYGKAKQARRNKELQWYTNLAMSLGNQWVKKTSSGAPEGLDQRLVNPKTPYYKNRRSVNRVRRFTRWELSKFVSQTPSVISVPGTGSDEDVRASFAAEQVWTSISTDKNLRKVYTQAAWWTVHTGNGFVKTEWDPSCDEGEGDIKYSCVTPFNLFVPDLKEPEIEQQPFVFSAYTKQVQWVNAYYRDELDGATVSATTSGSNELLDPAYLNAQSQTQAEKNSVLVFEAWVKPGATDLLPNGGLVVMVEDILLVVINDGVPYKHGQYPFTHFTHLFTGGFYADSPIVDLIHLQKEYNQIRSDISEAGRRMARPQLLAQKGSVVVSRITNEPGLVIEYLPGSAPPTPMQMPNLPVYFIQQQDRILQDWTEISGEADASTGQAPAGVSAGTAINYLQEAANKYLTPQFQAIEFGWERIAQQTVQLFVQYVDVARKIKTAGADLTFDTMLLSGMDLANGTDLRVEAGSSVQQSQAANDAKVMDMFSMGLIDPPTALKMLEVGGFQRAQDIMKAAERKAQRENIKMKQLDPQELAQATQQHLQEVQQHIDMEQPGALDDPMVQQQLMALPPPLAVQVADFDIHETHILIHNQFRMMQEYESLDPAIQAQFEEHVAMHQKMMQAQQMQQFLAQVPSDGSDGSAPTANMPPGAPPQGPDGAAGGSPEQQAAEPAPGPGGPPNA